VRAYSTARRVIAVAAAVTDGPMGESDGEKERASRTRGGYNTDPKLPALRLIGTSAVCRTVLPRAANPMTVRGRIDEATAAVHRKHIVCAYRGAHALIFLGPARRWSGRDDDDDDDDDAHHRRTYSIHTRTYVCVYVFFFLLFFFHCTITTPTAADRYYYYHYYVRVICINYCAESRNV
jgi:hypothetical protein